MWWRIDQGEKWGDIKGAEAKSRLKRLVQKGSIRGLIAYHQGEPIGWCTFGKRTDFPRLNRARSLKCKDAETVCCIPCFYVANRYRKKGVSTELLKKTAQLLTEEGETVLEGYPVKPTKPGNRNIPGAFAWTGTLSLFDKQGFKLVGSGTTSKLRHRKVLN